MFAIIGLGNPGAQYEHSRHNVGFLFADYLAGSASFSKGPGQCLIAKTTLFNQPVVLAKPQSFMNLSGMPVVSLLSFFKIPIEKTIVVSDDLDQEFAAVRTRCGGSHGGHNGLRDILDKLGQDKFWRLKLGIGRPLYKSDTVSYVLEPFPSLQLETLHTHIFPQAQERLKSIVHGGTAP